MRAGAWALGWVAAGGLAVGGFAGLAGPALGQGGTAPVPLAPHRAVYELSLLRSQGARSVEGASGRIALEFSGDACDGYTLKFRQLSVLSSTETGTRTVDARADTFESPGADLFRFRTETQAEGAQGSLVDGTATRETGKEVTVRLSQPGRTSFTLPEAPLFPTGHLIKLLETARAGERTLAAPVYDGSGDGRKVYDTLAVIGPAADPAETRAVEAPLKGTATAGLRRWPMRLSYFAPGEGDRTPVYVMAVDLYEDGVSGALQIDYGEFALQGALTDFAPLPAGNGCRR